MPEHIRALVVVLIVGSLVWILARPAFIQVLSPETFVRWRVLWYVTTLAWFLSPSFWVYVGIMTVVLIRIARRERFIFGLYLLLLLAAPPWSSPIPGMGIIDHFFLLDHYRLLALVLLLPLAWRLSKLSSTVRLFQSPVDWMVLAYLVLNTLLTFRGGNFTSDARTGLMLWIDFFLPYYVASRSIQSMEDLRHALMGLTVGAVLLGALAIVEIARSWKLYDAASAALGLNPFFVYKTRGPFVRPGATVIDSISLGYVMVVATGAFLYLQSRIEGRFWRWMGWLALATGVLACLSRGPWLGAFLLIFVFLITSPQWLKSVFQGATVATCLLLALSATSAGKQFIDLLPIVGSAEQGNIEYRSNLLTIALPVIERNFLFGSANFYDAPELEVMRQGEGIIDIVNSYIGVALHAGIVGLILFVGMFIRSLLALRRGMKWAQANHKSEQFLVGRALFAAVVSIMFIIFTVSSIFIMPIIYFVFIGLSCAFGLMHAAQVKSQLKWTPA